MHILLTDVLSCPRCGPEFGLIVLADRLGDRRIVEGSLGCANCREQYPVRSGIADLRLRPTEAGGTSAPPPPSPDPERGYRLAALLGVTGPAGPVLVVTRDVGLVEEVQRHLPEAGVLGVSRVAPAEGAGAGMGWLLTDGALPFRDRTLGGIALASGDPHPAPSEVIRTLSRGGRVVVDPAPPGTAEALAGEGAEILLEQGQVTVASAPGAR